MFSCFHIMIYGIKCCVVKEYVDPISDEFHIFLSDCAGVRMSFSQNNY